MNKSAYSDNGRHNDYSQMIDPTSPLISKHKQKQKLKKSMFQKKPDEQPVQTLIEYGKPIKQDQLVMNDTGDFNKFQDVVLDQKNDNEMLLRTHKIHKHLQKSFEMEDKERQCLQLSERGNLWIILALLAGICYAFNNFFLGQLSHHGFTAVIYVNIPSFALFMIVYSVNLIRNKIVHGFFWSREVSIFFKEEDESLDKSILLGVCMMSLCKFLGFYMVVQTFHYATMAGMNLGIITVIFNFCCITDSIVFYFFFNERLSKPQILGVSVLLLSAYFISLKSENDKFVYPYLQNETNDQYFERVERLTLARNSNAMYAIFTALICTLFFSARDVILRYYRINKHYPAFELSLDSLTLYSFGCSIYGFYYFVILGEPFDIDSFYSGCMSAVLNTLGFMMLGISVVIGYAGPANALNSIQAVVLTMLSISILNHIPTRYQVIGMLLGMLGTIIVSTGDAIMKLFGFCCGGIGSTTSHHVDNPDVYKKLNH